MPSNHRMIVNNDEIESIPLRIHCRSLEINSCANLTISPSTGCLNLTTLTLVNCLMTRLPEQAYNLQHLAISNCPNILFPEFPEWPSIQKISINNSMPRLARLPLNIPVRELTISSCTSIIDMRYVGWQKLTELTLLDSIGRITLPFNSPLLRKIVIERSNNISIVPHSSWPKIHEIRLVSTNISYLPDLHRLEKLTAIKCEHLSLDNRYGYKIFYLKTIQCPKIGATLDLFRYFPNLKILKTSVILSNPYTMMLYDILIHLSIYSSYRDIRQPGSVSKKRIFENRYMILNIVKLQTRWLHNNQMKAQRRLTRELYRHLNIDIGTAFELAKKIHW